MSTRRVIVETNWVLDVALERDPGSVRLWKLAQAGAVTLLLPSFCLTEAVKALENTQAPWEQAKNTLLGHKGDIERSTALRLYAEPLEKAAEALAKLKDHAEERIWTTLQSVSRLALILPPSAEVLDLTASIRSFLKHSPADAVVLATVIVTSRGSEPKQPFLSRDKAFRQAATQQYLKEEGIPFFGAPLALLQSWRLAEGVL